HLVSDRDIRITRLEPHPMPAPILVFPLLDVLRGLRVSAVQFRFSSLAIESIASKSSMSRRRLLPLFGALLTTGAIAQGYPSGPVRVIVPFPPGGGVDGAGRLISQKLSEALGRPFVVENRAGANGMIGSELAAKAPKDGYTLMVNGANFVTNT